MVTDISRKAASFIPVFWVSSQRYKLSETKLFYLTDMRGELLEPTENTPADLYSIYNYDDD